MVGRSRGGNEHLALNRPARRFVHPNFVDAKGRLVPPFRQLSRAAAKDESARSDWERRVLAAARWLSLGLNSIWAADRLVAVMVALECLFVEGPSEQYKGAAIARRFTERFEMHERTAEEQEEWLVRLYRSRNAAAHEGRSFTDDLDVDRLTELTHYVVREMSYHLIPGHRRPGRSCRTWAQAMRCSAP